MKSLAVVMVMTGAGVLSACSSPDPTIKDISATARPPQTQAGNATEHSALDDGILHVWPREVTDRVFFDLDKSTVRPEGREVLAKWVVFLDSHPKDQLLIEGHSDERGTREYNLALGERRADAIKEFLLANGIQANRIRIVSYGKERPAVLGSNEAAYAQNRRGVGVLQ